MGGSSTWVRPQQSPAPELPGLPEDRRTVIAGDLAILRGAFKALKVEHMITSRAAREGLLFELVGRMEQADIRVQTARIRSVDRVPDPTVRAG